MPRVGRRQQPLGRDEGERVAYATRHEVGRLDAEVAVRTTTPYTISLWGIAASDGSRPGWAASIESCAQRADSLSSSRKGRPRPACP